MATGRTKAGPAKAGEETKTTTYLAPGVRPNPYEGNEPTLDPELAKIRDEEAKALSEVKIDRSFPEPTIDPELVKLRDAEIKRGAKVIGGTTTPVASASTSDATAAKAPAKKSAAKKSSK